MTDVGPVVVLPHHISVNKLYPSHVDVRTVTLGAVKVGVFDLRDLSDEPRLRDSNPWCATAAEVSPTAVACVASAPASCASIASSAKRRRLTCSAVSPTRCGPGGGLLLHRWLHLRHLVTQKVNCVESLPLKTVPRP